MFEIVAFDYSQKEMRNFKDNELEVSDIVTKRDYQRAKKIVDERGMINMSGIYGFINVTIPKQKLLEYQIATLKVKLLNANQKLEEKEKELTDTRNSLYQIVKDTKRGVKREIINERDIDKAITILDKCSIYSRKSYCHVSGDVCHLSQIINTP